MLLKRVLLAGLLVAGLVIPASAAASPPFTVAPGLVKVSEKVLPNGAAVGVFKDGKTEIRVIGWPGTSVESHDVAKGNDVEATVTVKSNRGKSDADKDRYAKSGRSVRKDLEALGAPPDQVAQFADMQTPDGAAPEFASAASPTWGVVTSAVSSTTPWDVQCVTISREGGVINGSGCSTSFLVAASNGDWWLNSKYKLSMRSIDDVPLSCYLISVGCPWRLTNTGWALGWSSGNTVYDWDPAGTVPKSGCSNTTVSAGYHGFGISVSGTVCKDKLQPWNLSSTRSGSEWIGPRLPLGDYVATIGTQGTHSPPNASASHSSVFKASYSHYGP